MFKEIYPKTILSPPKFILMLLIPMSAVNSAVLIVMPVI